MVHGLKLIKVIFTYNFEKVPTEMAFPMSLGETAPTNDIFRGTLTKMALKIAFSEILS